MSTRQLFSSSRSDSRRESTSFQLQSPPHRYKENRRCRVLSKRDEDPVKGLLQASLVRIKSPLSPKKRKGSSIMSAPLLEEASLPARDDDTISDAETIRGQSEIHLDHEFSNNEDFGGIITSPVKCDVRNSAFFGEACVWSPQTMTEYEASADKQCMSASRTSSFHSIARTVTTFGAIRKRGSSLQSMKSPTEKQKGSPSTNGEVAHTVLPMSPLSPFAFKNMPPLDTPAELHFDHINTHLVLPICEHEYEPLSATLKRLGAARNSIELDEEEEDLSQNVKYSQQALAGWEQNLAERVASQKQAVEANKEALYQSKGLFEASKIGEQSRDKDTGSHFSWLHRDPTPTIMGNPGYVRIQSTARGGPRRNIRSSMNSISTILANHIFRRGQYREEIITNTSIALNTISENILTRPDPAAPRAKGDGWGGLRPRSSWFPDLAFGPLASPLASPIRHLRPLQLLQPSQGIDRDVWVDEMEEEDERKSKDEPVIRQQDDFIRKLRVRFPSYLPKPSRDRHLSMASTNVSFTDQGTTVKYTENSAEGIPTSKKQTMYFMRVNGGLLLAFLLVIGMAAFVAVIGTQAIKHASVTTHRLSSNDTAVGSTTM